MTALALSGGGARGIYQAHRLVALEQAMAAAGETLYSACDIYAGTSVGAIVAVLLAHQFSAVRISSLLTDLLPEIFARPWKSRLLSRHYYDRAALVRSGRRLAPLTCGGLKKRVLIHAYRKSSRRTPVTFDTADPALAHVPAIELAIASAAAPTYFGPYYVEELDEVFSDGGTTANNPSMRAYVVGARRIVSIGTGQRTRLYTTRQAMAERGARQALGVVAEAMDNAELVVSDMRELLGASFVHLDGELLRGVNDDMDDASPRQITLLQKLAREHTQAQPEALADAVRVLQA